MPIASHESKLWEEEHWRQLIKKALSLGYPILLPSGNTKEEQRAQRLALSPEVIALPRLSLSEIGYLVLHAKAVVSLDTGISHMAAALGTPAVTLYGPTDPFLTGTIGENQIWISSFTTNQISSADVLEKLTRILKSNQKKSLYVKLNT